MSSALLVVRGGAQHGAARRRAYARTVKASSLFITSLIGTSVSGAVLVLLVPSSFLAGEQGGQWPLGAFAGLTLAFAAGARRWRPPAPAPRDG